MTGAEPSGTHLERLARDGYTVLDRVIEDHLVEELRLAIARLDELDPPRSPPSAFEGRRTSRHYNVLAKDPAFMAAVRHPSVLGLVEQALDEGCLLSSLSTITIGPGETAQPIHADDLAIRLPRPHPVPLVVTAMWALTDFTSENGATRVVPGSHRFDHVPALGRPDPDESASARPIEMAYGSVLVYLGSLWHGGGANRTNQPRAAMAASYCAGWIRPQENQLIGIPQDLAATMPERLRVLLGWGVYNSQMGHIEKQRPGNLVLGRPPADDPDPTPAWDPPITTPLLRLDLGPEASPKA